MPRSDRAREDRASAEVELLSSTSTEVCELWTGSRIVRIRGQPKMSLTFLRTDTGEIFPITSEEDDEMFQNPDDIGFYSPPLEPPPNLSLNVSSPPVSRIQI